MLRLLADENFDHDLVRGTLRRRPELAFSTIINDLLLLDECSDTSEWYDRIQYLPLR